MRGRLRVVGGDGGENTSWAEVPAEYWSRVAGDGAIPVIPQPSTPLVGEIPPYVGDSSNLDSTDSEVDTLPKKQKKPRRIPPPNPPYRTRKRGRYSMLRGLFKNTADNPVVLDDSGPAGSQPSQEEVVHDQGKTETTEKKGKKAVPRKKVTKPEEKKKKSAKQNERKTMKQNERKTVKQDEKKSAKKKEKVEDFGQTNASQILQLEEEEEIEQLIAQGTVVGEEEEQTGRRNYCSCTEDCEKAHEQQTSAGPSNPSAGPSNPSAASKTNPSASSNASANSTAPSKTTTSHGGIIRPFKPPAAISRQNPLGVEPIPGQKFTSLKNLEAAKTKMQKNMGKKN
ncbi:hypothetical protein DCAR_0624477 [Daucus carota subsp. sativus]|uniref:Uncharacterized protein n=1 Tax=Daucus carota subsp. sativus TaxID=79200 RepID=A0A164VV29_DAUCS|nr:hypothetical protein DCAR_0624477 [Daucus carota subsp. sativus]